MLADGKDIKQRYWEEKSKRKMVKNIPADVLKQMGYSDEEVEKLKSEL